MGLVHLRFRPALNPARAAMVVESDEQQRSAADDDDSPDQRDYEVRETLCSM